MYEEITAFRKTPGEVINMFSEALRIMDRNTTKYMIDELHEQIESQSRTITAQDQTITDLNQTVSKLKKRIEELEEREKSRN